MKIAYVSYPTYGGSGIVASEIAKFIAELGNEVFFISHGRPVRLRKFHKNIHLYEVSPPDYPLFKYPPFESALIGALTNLIRYEEIQLLHIHYAIPFAINAITLKNILKECYGIQIPVILTLHGSDVTLLGKNPLFQPVLKYALNSADKVTVVSEFLRDETVLNFSLQKPPQVIYNFVDTELFAPTCETERKNLFPREDAIGLIHVSNFRKVKRTRDIVEILKKVTEKTPAYLVFVGDGPERPRTEHLVHKYNLEEYVFFLGRQENLEKIYPLADVCIMTSKTESFGLCVLEAMSCGLPAISYRVGGIPEIVEDGKNGFLVDYKDIENAAKKIVGLAKNPEEYIRMATQARETAWKFDRNNILPQYLKLYDNLLQKN